jgi:hypothetical protein
MEMYSFGRKHPNNPIDGGFVKEDVISGTYSKYPETTCVIYQLEVTERDIEKMKRVLNVFKKNQKKLIKSFAEKKGFLFANRSIKRSIKRSINDNIDISIWKGDTYERTNITAI